MYILTIPLFLCHNHCLLSSQAAAEIKNMHMPWEFDATLLLADGTCDVSDVFSFGKVVRRKVSPSSEIGAAAAAIVSAMEWFEATAGEKCYFTVACSDDHTCECLSQLMHTESDLCFVSLIDSKDSETFVPIQLPSYHRNANDAANGNEPNYSDEPADYNGECSCNFFMEKFVAYTSSSPLGLTLPRNTRISSDACSSHSETTRAHLSLLNRHLT
ncbi:MAG: hypothetical protein LBI61_00660 [Puniceicoccales bacterium]|nr:hypothetical protein [Puniceicoccales bacterium]